MSPVPQHRRWTCEEFYELCVQGLFNQKRIMLIDGEILEMPLADPPHATAESLADDALRTIFHTGFVIRIKKPLPLGQSTDPVPDLAVVAGTVRDFARVHPTTAVLVVEIGDYSLEYDLGDKASLYASAGIADYWVVDLVYRQVLVMRDPAVDAGQRFGHGYAAVTRFAIGKSVSPLAAPATSVSVSDLMP